MEAINPYESPALPATPALAADEPTSGRRAPAQRRIEWLVGLQVVGLIALLALRPDIRQALRVPGWLPGPLTIAVAVPTALALGMLLIGPTVWLRVVLGQRPSGENRLWWFVVLEPVLLALTLLALIP